ncbi:jg12304, partial [Pararge aegeria aegeria]
RVRSQEAALRVAELAAAAAPRTQQCAPAHDAVCALVADVAAVSALLLNCRFRSARAAIRQLSRPRPLEAQVTSRLHSIGRSVLIEKFAYGVLSVPWYEHIISVFK